MSVSPDPQLARLVARKAVLSRWEPDSEELAEVSRAHAERKAELFIRNLVAQAPPLTQEQRDRLAMLLRGGGSDAP